MRHTRLAAITIAGWMLLAGACAPARGEAAPATDAGDANARTPSRIRAEIESLQDRIAALQNELKQAEARSGEPFFRRMVNRVLEILPDTAGAWTWFVVGFGGQVIFFLRFVVQWWASEKAKRTVVPMAFWYLSISGTLLVLSYALWRLDPLFILAYSLNVAIYVRNLYIARMDPSQAVVVEKESE